MAVRLSVSTLTLIRLNEHRARAYNICIIAAILMPFDAECIWCSTRGFPPSMSPSDLVCLALAAVKCRLQTRRFSQSVGIVVFHTKLV